MPIKRVHKGSLTTGYKKQHGIHHKHSEKYLKVYWPYLPVFLFVVAGISASIALISLKPYFSSSKSNITVNSLLVATNNARTNDKINPLVLNLQLNSAAQIKANDMVKQNYWSPISPSGQTPWQIVQQQGYSYKTAGENLAYGFPSSTNLLSAWLHSPSHSQNILNNGFSNVGFGIAKSSDFQNNGPQTIIVAIYASPANGIAIPQSSNIGSSSFTTASVTEPNSIAVSKIEAITDDYALNTFFFSGLIVGIVVCYLVVRHTLILKKWVLQGERVIVSHPIIDIVLIVFIVGLASLNQTVGIMR